MTSPLEQCRDALRLFTGAACPVSTEIDTLGYAWSNAYLDGALPHAIAALAAADAELAARQEPVAWLCELAMEDGSTRTQFVTEDPDGLRWNDAGEPSPYRTTPLYAAPKEPA